jgi:cell fate (sporulation/competence/biofilm development) regulator YlbF (YheA/YmcA/DUF963 family)
MSEGMLDKAKEVGRLIGQTDEYKELQKARERLNEDRETVELVNRLSELEQQFQQQMQQGEQPTEEEQQEYQELMSELQSGPRYQAVVAAQSNFDKIVEKVNEKIGEGIEAGAASSIIMPS